MKKRIFNLEFDSYVNEYNIFRYKFIRDDNYEQKVKSLQHPCSSTSEFTISVNTGMHEQTAYVEIPEEEEISIIEWKDTKTSALYDVLLLLSLFTGREVFDVENDFNENTHYIVSDPRVFQWGGILRTSIPFVENKHAEEFEYDVGFNKALNDIYLLIRSSEWQEKYEKGYFLLLAKNAFKRQILETAFTQCWTIWEHLFALHTKKWLSQKEIMKINSIEKISFLFVEYALKGEIDSFAKERIKDLTNIRNRLIHNGRFPKKDSVIEHATLFIRLTEFIISKILGLNPSNIFNTIDKLDEFLNKSTKNK